MTKQASLFAQSCTASHYVAIVDAYKDVEIYQHGDVDCSICLQLMVDKHQETVAVLRSRLAVAPEIKRCRVYDTTCLNPTYCDVRDACCAGDPNCRAGAGAMPRALCHACLEMVDVVAGKLSPHHGTSGDGCPQNDAVAQIYLHPRAADRIAELEAALVFGVPGGTR